MRVVGDVLFKYCRYNGLSKVKIEKVTPKGNIRVSDGSLLNSDLKKKTTDTWDVTTYYRYSDELEEKYKEIQEINKIKKELKLLQLSELNSKEKKELLEFLTGLEYKRFGGI